jgi:tetratricopeptide (TPR) repeat protein
MKDIFMAGMKLKQQILFFLFIVVVSSAYNSLFSQSPQPKPSRQSSFEAFSKGDYEQAYKEFGQLLQTYSKDPLYKYYSGVCLVKLNRDPARAVVFLKQALQGAAVFKTLPTDAYFYLGRSQQMSGNFTEAIESYNLFTQQVGKKASKDQDVPQFIQQCNEKRGELAGAEITQPEIIKNDKVEVPKTEAPSVTKEIIQPPVEIASSSKIVLPVGYDKILDEAIEFQIKADSLNALVIRQKKDLETLPDTEKPAFRNKIKENELLAVSFQKSADQKYSEAQSELVSLKKKAEQKAVLLKSDNTVSADTLQHTEINDVKESSKVPDMPNTVVPVTDKPQEIFSLFEVLATPVPDADMKIIIDGEAPDGLIYRIQIGVFSKSVAPSYFKGITPIYAFKVAGTENKSYYAGMFRRNADAGKALLKVRSAGFKDAFVVALSGNTRVSADRAAIMEKEWENKPLLTISQSPADTVPPTLLFRVEAVRSLKPLKDDVVEGIKKVAGNRGLDIQPIDNGSTSYLIGKFITFDSAAEYADILIRNGYREARVVAFLGKKEIPVETAKQLVKSPK